MFTLQSFRFAAAIACAVGMTHAYAAGTAKLECYGVTPMLTVTYSAGADSGQPGVTYLGAISPDQKSVAFVDLSGTWQAYQGGQYPPNARYDSGLPASKIYKVGLPAGAAYNTLPYAGYQLYIGQGVLTAASQQMVRTRRDSLDKAKPGLVAKGQWNSAYDDDDQFKLALVQKDMTDNNKYAPIFTIPAMDCNPQSQN